MLLTSTLLTACSNEDQATIYLAKQIVTMDQAQPEAEAAVVKDNTIQMLGDLQTLSAAFPSAIIDHTFKDKVLIPGLIDPHVHMIMGAMIYSLPFVPPWDMETPEGLVKGLPNKQALLKRLTELAGELDQDEPLIAYGYHNLIHGDLTKQDLDTISTNRPIIVWHYSGHDFYLNSYALQWASVDKSLAEKYTGVGIDTNGELTGRLYEDAPEHLFGKLSFYMMTPGNIGKGFSGFEAMLAKAGITAVADLGYGLFGRRIEDIYYWLEYTSEDPYLLYLVPEHRAFKAAYGDEAAAKVRALGMEIAKAGDPQVLPQIKFFTDAAFYSQTMRLDKPGYLGGQSAGTNGLWVTPPQQLAAQLQPYWQLGIQIRIHSNGDAAQTATLDAIAELNKKMPKPAQRFVIEHAGLMRPEHIEKLASLPGGISAASHYVYYMGDDYREAIGERVKYITPLASASQRAIPVTLHSDAPLAPPYPLQAASVHMTRATRQGNVSTPEESLSAYAALKSVTLDAAWALGLEESIGSISVGKIANFTVLDKNPLITAANEWPNITVWGVVLRGKKMPLTH